MRSVESVINCRYTYIPKCNVEVGIYAKLPANILAHKFHLSLLGSLVSYGRGDAWRWKWERVNGGVKGCTISLIGCGTSRAYALGPDEKEDNPHFVNTPPPQIVLFMR
jgi:hypothetical protein